MGSIVLKSLSVLLGVFFVFIGTMKLTSSISKDLHKDLVRKLGNKSISSYLRDAPMEYRVESNYSLV